MPLGEKRRRRASPGSKELAHGEQLLKQFTLTRSGPARWSWVGTEVTTPDDIVLDHQLAAYGFASTPGSAPCQNKYSSRNADAVASEVDEDEDIIIVSDDESHPTCSKKDCKGNPQCLNYMGQEIWENGNKIKNIFKKLSRSGDDPNLLSREPDLPVGLKNLGATCYANSSLQVWFRDIAFRNGVYQCHTPEASQDRFKDSPIFQLQVTFAALRESKESVFNPSSLVESLQLRTSEQQDAQEFSKLFMSHLDAEFKKQTDPTVKMLIESQFQGNQVYGTFCHACQYKSERTTDFLEMEINFDGPSRLEERISASLEHETLSGDNRYFCPECSCLQEATRYTELRQLPPVLHFSLLRFVYDLQTMERKKQKHAITFPTILDMRQFLGEKDDSEGGTKSTALAKDDNMYELRGVLLHKGSSAYHGHYEAQVYDTELTSWFQFNDETVTNIASLVDKPRGGKDTAAATAKEKRGKARPKKKRRIEDSCDEQEEFQPTEEGKPLKETEQLISSKDAYMLVYARQGHGKDCIPIDPPLAAIEVVNDLNDIHEKTCEEHEGRNDSIKKAFQERLALVQNIYREWQTSELAEDSVVVSEQSLRNWLSERWYADIISHASNEASSEAQSQSISNTEIICEHGKLDPSKAGEMKAISQNAYQAIIHQTACSFDPILTISDICATCVIGSFKERLYETSHSRLARQCEELQEIQSEDDVGFWISKPWFKDWKGSRPKMHVFAEEDPPPDAPNFYSDVLCEHDAVTPSPTHRKKISKEAKELLTSLFPSWQPPPSDSDICAVCEAQASMSKEDKREMRRKAEEEKSKLKNMNSMTYAFFSGTSPYCALIPGRFYKAWKRWVDSPTSQPRPEAVDNTPFLCESHSMLLYDPNCTGEIDSIITIIRRDEWDQLASFYAAGPMIALQKNSENRYETDIAICSDCRMRRQKHWDETEIIVQLSGKEAPNSKPLVTNGSSSTRQSKRLRKKQGDRRKITVSKDTSVKDIKIMISELFEIPTICQKLTLHGVELYDNKATADSLDILANDILELQQMKEEIDIDAVSDAGSAHSKPREEGRGFNGTVLGGRGGMTDSSIPSSRSASLDPSSVEKTCKTCTFANDPYALTCAICDTIFE